MGQALWQQSNGLLQLALTSPSGEEIMVVNMVVPWIFLRRFATEMLAGFGGLLQQSTSIAMKKGLSMELLDVSKKDRCGIFLLKTSLDSYNIYFFHFSEMITLRTEGSITSPSPSWHPKSLGFYGSTDRR